MKGSSIMHMRKASEISLSSGKPPGRPPDTDLVGKTSQFAAPNLDLGGFGALEDKATTLGDLGKLKEEGTIFPLSSSPTLLSDPALWEEKKGSNKLPTYTFGIGDVKEEIRNMT